MINLRKMNIQPKKQTKLKTETTRGVVDGNFTHNDNMFYIPPITGFTTEPTPYDVSNPMRDYVYTRADILRQFNISMIRPPERFGLMIQMSCTDPTDNYTRASMMNVDTNSNDSQHLEVIHSVISNMVYGLFSDMDFLIEHRSTELILYISDELFKRANNNNMFN